jgi:hypothetical protein
LFLREIIILFNVFCFSKESNESSQIDHDYSYFLRIKSTADTFTSNIFRPPHEPINDLFQFELSTLLEHNSITLTIELHKLANFTQAKLVAVGTLTLDYADFYASSRRVCVHLSSSNNLSAATLKIKYCKLSTQPRPLLTSYRSSMLKLSDVNGSLTANEKIQNFLSERISIRNDADGSLDLDRLEAVVDPIFDLKLNDFVVVRRILVLFSHLNTKPLHSHTKPDTAAADRDHKRLVKQKITFKLYELFIRLVSQMDSIEHFEHLYADLATSVSDGMLHAKQIVQCVVNILKDLFDSDLFTSVTYELTLECMDFLIKMLVDLSRQSSKSSLFELKYSLNDLILNKLVRQIRQSQIKMYLAYCKLNLRFLNHLCVSDEFFNGNELALISIKLLSFDGSSHGANSSDLLNENVVNSIINLFNLDIFQTNFQFRDRLIEHLLNNYFLNVDKCLTTGSSSSVSSNVKQMLRLVRIVLKNKLKLNKLNFEAFLKFGLGFLVDAQLANMKSFDSTTTTTTTSGQSGSSLAVEMDESASCNGDSQLAESSASLIDTFLCLMDTVDYIVANVPSHNMALYFDTRSLKSIFDIVMFYFKYGSLLSLKQRFKLTLNIELIVLKFVKYIQKFLFKYLISKQFDVAAVEAAPDDTRTTEESFLVSYFDMMFVFVEQNNTITHTYYLKAQFLQAAHAFWTELHMKLKRSSKLNQFLIRNLVKCLIVNSYFKRDFFELDSSGFNNGKQRINDQLPIFISKKCVETFNRALFGFLTDIVNVDHALLNCVCLSLVEYVIKYDKYKRSYSKKLMSDFDELNNLATTASGHLNDTTDNVGGGGSGEDEGNTILATYAEHHDAYIFGLKCCSRLVYSYLAERECSTALGAVIFDRMRLGFDYNFLKEVYEKEKCVSVVERYLFLYDLFKLVERLALGKDYLESKRKIKIYILGRLLMEIFSSVLFLQLLCDRC